MEIYCLLPLLLVASCWQLTTATCNANSPAATLQDLQVIHAHNSYHGCFPASTQALLRSPVFQGFAQGLPFAGDLLYAQPSLTELLTRHGVRSLEIDVAYDPAGGLYHKRAACKLANVIGALNDTTECVGPAELLQPGFKVLHIPDLDFNSSCLTFVSCLKEIKAWSDKQPKHDVLLLTLEIKKYKPSDFLSAQNIALINNLLATSALAGPTALAAIPHPSPQQVIDLEAELLSVFPRKQLYTPSNFRGNASSVRAVADKKSFPRLSKLRGRILVRLTEVQPFTGYLQQLHPRGGGTVLWNELFSSSAARAANDTIFLFEDPFSQPLNASAWRQQVDAGLKSVKSAVEDGYMYRVPVASRPQADNNFTYLATAAAAAGVHLLHTDFPGGWTGSKARCGNLNSSLTVSLPPTTSGLGPATATRSSICNPVTAPVQCRKLQRNGRKPPSACTCLVSNVA